MFCPNETKNLDKWLVIEIFLNCKCGSKHQWCLDWFDSHEGVVNSCINEAVESFDLDKLKTLDKCFGILFPGRLKDYAVFGRLVNYWLSNSEEGIDRLMEILDYLQSIGECEYDLFDSIESDFQIDQKSRCLLELIKRYVCNGQIHFLVGSRD